MKLPLTLDDLNPQDTILKLSTHAGPPIVLQRWSLYVRSWALKRFGTAGLQRILEQKEIEQVAELVYFMVRDKKDFPTFDDFLKAIVTTKDQLSMVTSLLGTIGISEPKVEEIEKLMKERGEVSDNPKLQPPAKKTGGKSSTNSPAATRGAPRKSSAI